MVVLLAGLFQTLAFVLPILNILASRKVKRLQALVVLPSRDLGMLVAHIHTLAPSADRPSHVCMFHSCMFAPKIAQQVYEVFQRYSRGSNVCVGLAIGQPDTRTESEQYMQTLESQLLRGDPLSPIISSFQDSQTHVDVLVCTPGRLMDHLDTEPGFTLQHLRYLVVDEVDKLLSQPYQDWISRVLDATTSAGLPPGARPRQLRKLLFSATLTRDPQKLSALRLVRPRHFDARELARATDSGVGRSSNNDNAAKTSGKSYKFSMPPQLHEYTVECTAEQKPIVLLALLLERLDLASSRASSIKKVVAVFTSSVDSTHRLARLLQLLWKSAGFGDPDAIAEFSSSLNQHERSLLMKRCESGNTGLSVIVCSDGMSRGINVEVIGTVVNYDVPNFAKTYVHRCGRTARAGKDGLAVSLLKGGQVAQFTRMRQTIKDPSRVKPKGVQKNLVRAAIPVYMSCLKKLPAVLTAEGNGDLRPTAPIPSDMYP